MIRVFANGPEDWGSILGRDIPKTQMILQDGPFLNTRHFKVQIRVSWVIQGVAIEIEDFGSLSTTVGQLT